MGFQKLLAGITVFGLLAGSASATDLSKIPRTIAKEPAYKTKPKYCLLVFGPEAKTRIWLAEDGDTLYVDRNGNGDLTEPGEAVETSDRRDFKTQGEDRAQVPYRDQKYVIGKLTPTGTSQHTEFKVSRYQRGTEPPNYVVSGMVNGVTLQYAGWTPILTDNRESALIIHFGGPVAPQPIRVKSLTLGNKSQELHLRFCTPGLGKYSAASLGYEAIPETIHPVVEIDWPSGGQPIKTTATLTHRC